MKCLFLLKFNHLDFLKNNFGIIVGKLHSKIIIVGKLHSKIFIVGNCTQKL